MKNNLIFMAFAIMLMLSSCATKVTFTQELREELEKATVPLDQIQLYNSKKIILKRVLEEGKASVETGKLKMEEGKLVHYIVLKKNTPGISVAIENSKIIAKFEEGSQRELSFGVRKKKYKNTPYFLLADSWNKREGRIMYDNQVYFIQPGGGDATLMIKKNTLRKNKKTKRKMSGLKL